MTLSLKDSGWLTGQDNIHLSGEVDLSPLSCLTISNDNLCFKKDPSSKQSISACSDSIWNWDTKYVIKFCYFEVSLKEQHQPIRISDDIWILHKEIIPNYYIICQNLGSKVKTLIDWAKK
jgi:hypothetical protein